MQIGFVGLGEMGGNMVHRIRRDSDHDIVAFDFSADAVKAAEGVGASGASYTARMLAALRNQLGGHAVKPAEAPGP